MPTNPVLTGPEAESWLLDHGLPWFVREVDDRIRQLVAPRRLAPVLLAFVVVAAGVHVVVLRFGDPAGALSAAVATLLLLLLGYAAGPLRLGVMSRWAARVAFRHVSLILPLALRALPMLLLFMTFLFINTEVWQVAGALTVPRLWAAVLVFSALGGLVPGTLFSLAVRLAPAPDTVSTTVGWMQQWSSFGQFAGPPVVAWVAGMAGGWQWTWLATGISALTGIGLTAIIGRRLRRTPRIE